MVQTTGAPFWDWRCFDVRVVIVIVTVVARVDSMR